MTYNDNLNSYIDSLSRLEELGDEPILDLITDDFVFVDPFNNITGKESYKYFLIATLKDCSHMKFQITSLLRDSHSAFLTWEFTFTPKNKVFQNKAIQVPGMSELKLNSAGLLTYHRDYWDASSTIYERLPMIGFILKKLRQRIASGHTQ